MKTKIVLKLVLLGCLIVGGFRLLQGHDILTGMALVALFLWARGMIFFAVMARRNGGSGLGNGGLNPPHAPIPVSPRRPKSPEYAEAMD